MERIDYQIVFLVLHLMSVGGNPIGVMTHALTLLLGTC